jgi:hypothetical protein
MLINPVAVEKVGFPEKSQKSGDRKYLEDWGKSFVELPDATQFLRIRGERVFQQPPLLPTVIWKFSSANNLNPRLVALARHMLNGLRAIR